MEVIRIPIKFKKSCERLTDKERSYIFSSLFTLASGEDVEIEDTNAGDILSLIYTESVNMDKKIIKKKGNKASLAPMVHTNGAIKTAPKDATIIKDNIIKDSIKKEIIISSKEDTKQVLIPEETFGKEEINIMQKFLRQAVGVSSFKDSKERWYVTHCHNLMKKIGKDEFQFRLKEILSDPFKAKNSNKLEYLYKELKAFIHSPVVEIKKESKISPITF